MQKSSSLSFAWLLAGTILATGTPVLAQSTAQAPIEDIIVTARKRDETSLSVPVAITAVSSTQMERRAINSMDSLAQLVPGLIIGEGDGAVQGGEVAFRGIGAVDSNPLSDSAVAFNIDGVQVALASVRRVAEMDLEQAEVLEGPQALYYGKNSPGGIISMRSKDPTDHFQAGLNVGYEFVGRETRGEGYISGPITDSLGGRIAVYGSSLKGYFVNTVPSGLITSPSHQRYPYHNEYAIRGTLKYEPNDTFNARLKVAYNEVTGSSMTSSIQLINCPTGVAQTGGNDNCKPDNTVSTGDVGPNFGLTYPGFGNGQPYYHQNQMLAGLEMNYKLPDNLTVTSVSGFYKTHLRNMSNYNYSYVPTTIFASANRYDTHFYSEELRLTSSFTGPLNFMVGGHYQDSRGQTGSNTVLNAVTPALINNYDLTQTGTAVSVFGQAMWKIIPTVELSGGGRYSHESKELPLVTTSSVYGGPRLPITPFASKASWNNFSPEVTLTWRPTNTLTVFGSYKQGFLSGGFNAGASSFSNGTQLQYNQEVVKGGEIGVKALVLDGRLRTNFTLYTYKITGLQVASSIQQGLAIVQVLTNAGGVTTRGGELSVTYAPVTGLTLNGALAYDQGRYDSYFAPCYRGLTQPACRIQPNQFGVNALLENLAGTQLLRAPSWTGNAGFDYETPISSNLKVGFNGNVTYSSSFFADASSNPAGREPSFALLDASVRVGREDDRWQVMFLGKNLTNKYHWVRVANVPLTGSAPGAAAGSPSVLGDTYAPIDRGRELWLRVSTKFD